MIAEYVLVAVLWSDVWNRHINNQKIKLISNFSDLETCQTMASLNNSLDYEPWYFQCYKRYNK